MTVNRDELWRWLSSAPLPVVLSICLSTTGALGGWVWTVAAEAGDQKTVVAVAAEQAKAASAQARAIEARLVRLEEKLDHLLEAIADMRAVGPRFPASAGVRRPDKEKNR